MSRVDPVVIEELRQLDDGVGEVLKELVEMFVRLAPARVAAIQEAHASSDLKRLGAEAHSLKSSSANLGARRMAELCQRLEHARTPDAAAAAADAARELPLELGRVQAELLALLG